MLRSSIQRLSVGLAACGLAFSTGCSSMNNTQKGATIGGAIGAGVGTVVGAATGNPKTGLAAGTLIGAGIGGLAGADEDRREKEQADIRQATLEASQPAPASVGPMTVQKVIDLSRQQVSDEVIINSIRQSNSTYNLDPEDLGMLKQNGVSDRVVLAMQNAQARPRVAIQPPPPRTVVIHEPAPPPVVVYERPYWGPYYHRPIYVAPPPAFGVGVVIRK